MDILSYLFLSVLTPRYWFAYLSLALMGLSSYLSLSVLSLLVGLLIVRLIPPR